MGSGDKNTSRVSETRGEKDEEEKHLGDTSIRTYEGQKAAKRDQYELRVATQHLLHCFQVPEVWVCARKAVPTRGAVQHIKGDGEERERIQGGSQRVDRGSGVGGTPEERPTVNGRLSLLITSLQWEPG